MKFKSPINVKCIENKRDFSVQQLQQALKNYKPTDYNFSTESQIRRASVLLPLFCREGVWHVLFTRRTESVQKHKGQVSFPGGAMESSDADLVQTALRESYEEIGLKPEDVMILGRLGETQSITGYLISTFVGVIPWPYHFILSTNEVDKIFSIPLEWLVDPQHHEERTIVYTDKKVDGVIFFQDYQGEVLWGLSARLTLEFIRALVLSKTD